MERGLGEIDRARATHTHASAMAACSICIAVAACAIFVIPPDHMSDLCRYAKLERGLGEIDRARAIYIHASAMADPRRDPAFWADWNSFEVHYFCPSLISCWLFICLACSILLCNSYAGYFPVCHAVH